ncbi:membrane protein insertase, YidC/Oxa1 family, C-terminal domain-containing protein [Ruminococcaceae bacterium YRB3002]|nr:membrane protein insertase, YidC/Oxa1 family, C-terminal domain-containing protein [Ruminococcaceae bacterium YRB3002]
MSIPDILYTIIISPLELLFELIFAFSYKIIPAPAVNLVIMSIAVNLLVLPLYRRADRIQMETRNRENELRPVIDHIKKCFRGDEKVLMLQTYYRINNYSPLSSLKSVLSIFLQIPFFIAAYRFLSDLQLLSGQSMGPVADLSKPDGLITIGAVSINLLPVIMTAVNIISSEIYTKGQPFKDKITLYLTALVFLVLLYNSPSGLVFYWTLNNAFSLVKNIFYKIIPPKKDSGSQKIRLRDLNRVDGIIYIASASYLALLTGFLIPSSVISSSPEEFIHLTLMNDPNSYTWYTLCIAAGTFVLWIGVYYLLSSDHGKIVFSYAVFIVAIGASVNYFAYGADMGIVTPELVFEYSISYETELILLTTGTVILACVLFAFLRKILPRVMMYLVLAGLIAVFGMGVSNTIKVSDGYRQVLALDIKKDTPEIEFSTAGKNVVVLMMDRAIGDYIPYVFNEYPELVDKFDGFTYYPNTMSYGSHTNFGAPALFGGYEYTPEAMNSRDDMLLKDKHNESLLVMPVLFSRAGYDVTAIDMPYVNYSSIPQTDIFDQYENVNAYIAEDFLSPSMKEISEQRDITRCRNFFLYSLLRIAPTALQDQIYEGGNYHALDHTSISTEHGVFHFPQSIISSTQTSGVNPDFITSYDVLDQMDDLTGFNDDDKGSILLMDNKAMHSPMEFQLPDMTISDDVDNSEFFNEYWERYTVDGNTLHMDIYEHISHYQVTVKAMEKLGEWFDYLKANGAWDNTRIIIVSDHGRLVVQNGRLVFEDLGIDAEEVNPLLMVKDFDSHGYNTSDEFMTNADVPTIATEGLIEDPVNPFTGNPIMSDPKNAGPQKILLSNNWRVQQNNGYRFEPGSWYSVHDNIFDRNNWEYLGEY